MKRLSLPLFVVLALVALWVTACGSQTAASQDEHVEDDHHDGESMAHAHVDPPAEFAGLANPFAADHEAVEAGELIFQTNCATCHGPEGKGDGPASAELDPRPATLADGMMMGELSDGYLFWRVSKGGQMEPFNSAMPPWEAALTEEQRWQVISFVRALADDAGGHMDDDHMEDDHMDDDHMDDDHMDDDHMDDDHMDDDHTEAGQSG